MAVRIKLILCQLETFKWVKSSSQADWFTLTWICKGNEILRN